MTKKEKNFGKNSESVDEMNKKASHTAAFVGLMCAFIIVLGAASFVSHMNANELTGNAIRSEYITVGANNAIMLPGSEQAVPNEKEGTISIWTKPPIEVFDQFEDARKYIVFFSSKTHPGMRIVYNLEEKVFEAGLPILKSPKVDIFDNKPHNIIYTYKRGYLQGLVLDGQPVAESDFIEASATKITGFAIGIDGVLDEVEISGIEVAAYDHYLTPEEIADLN